jgi:hypothetical protein
MHINFFEYIRYFDNIGACFRVPHRAPDFTGSALTTMFASPDEKISWALSSSVLKKNTRPPISIDTYMHITM